MNRKKLIPSFQNEDEEREFWATHDLTDYFAVDKAIVNPSFPNLKPSTQSVTIRMTKSMVDSLKMLANEQDVPYQSLVKTYLHEKIQEVYERKRYIIRDAPKKTSSKYK